jgi:XTP/dITP diphosphohydrolase
MKTLLLATTNKAKLHELTAGATSLAQKGVKIVSLKDLNITAEPEETGKTFEENAKLKAEFYANLTNLPTIADDGGTMIDILNGEPGVKSKRWLGYDATDEELIVYTLKRLEGVPKEKRTAQIATCLHFYNPISQFYTSITERIHGYIAEKPSRNKTHGFPYRALLIVNEFNKYYDELTEQEHQHINHRFKALQKLILQIEQDLLE